MEVSCRLAGLRSPRQGARTTTASLGQRTICNDTRLRAFLQSAAVGQALLPVYLRCCHSTRGQAGVPVLLNTGRQGMSLNTDVHSIRRRFRVCAIVFFALLGLAGSARAQEPGAREKIYVVTHVDVVPTEAAAGTKIIKKNEEKRRKDQSALRVGAHNQNYRGQQLSGAEDLQK